MQHNIFIPLAFSVPDKSQLLQFRYFVKFITDNFDHLSSKSNQLTK